MKKEPLDWDVVSVNTLPEHNLSFTFQPFFSVCGGILHKEESQREALENPDNVL